jgi:hypothetical protein
MKWITRTRPKIDRVACPWLIERFIDQEPEFLYVPEHRLHDIAAEVGAIPFDVDGVELTHVGKLCSFDAFIKKYQLKDPALDRLARIVRGADTGDLALAPQSAGLLAIALGMSRTIADDHEVLRQSKFIYNALYSWCEFDNESRDHFRAGRISKLLESGTQGASRLIAQQLRRHYRENR